MKININPREMDGTSKKVWIQCPELDLFSLIEYLETLGFKYSRQLSIPTGRNVIILLRDETIHIKSDSRTIRNWIGRNKYLEASIVSEADEHQYLDKHCITIKVGSIVYYSELPLWNGSDYIGVVLLNEENELVVKTLIKNVDGIYQYDPENEIHGLYYYSIDDCGTKLETCKNLQVINAQHMEITVQFATKYFPLKRNFIPVASNIISIGDLVSVNFNSVQYTLTTNGEVIGIPGKDKTWIIKDIDTNEVFNISEPCTVAKRVL